MTPLHSLDQTHLYDIYSTFNLNYKYIFERVAIDILTTNVKRNAGRVTLISCEVKARGADSLGFD